MIHLYLSISRSIDGGPDFSTPVKFGPAFSSPEFSTPTIWSCVFPSCLFHHRIFHGPNFFIPAFSASPTTTSFVDNAIDLPWRNFPNRSLGQSSRGKCPNFWRYPNFLITQCETGGRKPTCKKTPRFVQSFRYNTSL